MAPRKKSGINDLKRRARPSKGSNLLDPYSVRVMPSAYSVVDR